MRELRSETGREIQLPIYAVNKLIGEARRIAAEYRRATGKTLSGVSSEIALYDACHYLNLELAEEPEAGAGFDAIGLGKREGQRVQIKARAIFDEIKSGQRIGQVKLDKAWDALVLLLLDEDFETTEIYEVSREVMEEALAETNGSARSKRGAMTVARFRKIAQLVWTRDEGEIDDDGELWEHPGA